MTVPGLPDERMDLSFARAARFASVREAMRDLEVDALLLSLGADLPWLTGYEAMALERLTVLVLPADDNATLVVPELEASRVDHDPRLFAMRPWSENEHPTELVAGLVGRRTRLAVSDRCWASHLLELERSIPGADWRSAREVVGPLRAVKDAHEVAALRAAGKAADAVAAALQGGEIALIGRTEADVSAEISARLRAEGHDRVNFSIVGSGPNSASPHHEPGRRVIGRGEAVVCDFGGSFRLGEGIGYCSDITRTLVTGEPDAELLEMFGVLHFAQAAAVAAAVVGTPCEQVDHAGRELITAAGYGKSFIHRIGHGIGIEEHEDPYMVAGNSTPLVAGHAFSVEPGIYLSGRFGARIEDVVIATDDGPLACNQADHCLAVVEA
ncbi:MAG: aminopeptidase P family protein [Acidimicrobiales bacterium]